MLMIIANVSAVLPFIPPFWLRFIGSLAAPLFVFLSGVVVDITAHKGFVHFLKRGAMVFGVGILVDLFIWRITPIVNFDVLYLIGITIPLAYLVSRMGIEESLQASLAVFCYAPLARITFHYTAGFTNEIPFNAISQLSLLGVFKSITIAGWFPILPWASLAFLGVAFNKWYEDKDLTGHSFKTFYLGLVGFSLLFIAIGLYFHGWVTAPQRETYIELFYPATPEFLLMALGTLGLLTFVVDLTSDSPLYKPLNWLGKHSLKIYVIHLALIAYVIERLIK